MKILAATSNAHKIEEIQTILKPFGITLISPKDIGGIPDVIEDKDSFEGNAIKKATEIAEYANMTVLADDSGLEVEALNWQPGIYSARYSGENATDQKNVKKLLQNLLNTQNRQARFTCVIAVASPGKIAQTAKGHVYGSIAFEPRGAEGFGYDPVFIPDGYEKTFAQLGEKIKNSLSHRKNALKNALDANIIT